MIAVLLQAAGPLGVDDVVAECGFAKKRVRAVLGELVRAGQVVEGRLLPDGPARQYRWAARWVKEAGRPAKDARRGPSRKAHPMAVDLTALRITATKPRGKIASLLAKMGISVLPVPADQDEGNVDRYILSKRLAVERRTGSGFLRGIMEKTLFTSAIYLREHFRIPVLIVEGQVNYEYSAFDPQAVRGALSSMLLQYGLSVLSTAGDVETAALIAMMARQEQIGIPEISLIPKRKAADLPDLQRRIVEMLPGCGMVLARELLQRFGSVKRVVNATGEEILAMRGIGAKKARDMHKALNAEYEAVDTERDLEDAIEAHPRLLFARGVELLARQHYIFADERDRHFVDMVFLDRRGRELILVELKRGRLAHEHVAQLRRYLDHAGDSPRLRSHLETGLAMRGVLATVEPCELRIRDRDITIAIVDRAKAVKVLKRLRAERLAELEARKPSHPDA